MPVDFMPNANPNLTGTLAELGIPEAAPLFAPHWQDSLTTLPATGCPFLQPPQVRRNRRLGELPPAADSDLLQTALHIRRNPALLRLAWHCRRLLYHHLDYDAGLIRDWPGLDQALPGQSGAVYLLVELAGAPLVYSRHRELGVPKEITRANCTNFADHATQYRKATGRWGVEPRLLPWMRHHTAGALFRVGRFQYMIKPFNRQIRVYRHKRTQHVLALAENGVNYDKNGYVARATEPEAPGNWTAHFSEEAKTVIGNPISPRGHAVPNPVQLPRRQWESVLQPGDAVFEMHIPAGGGMTPARTRESWRLAGVFFDNHFPGHRAQAFVCTSWVFNPRFAAILPPGANIRRVDEEAYLFPTPYSGKDGLYFIFGTDDVDLDTAPRDTSIRRVMLDELGTGQPLMCGGMLFLRDDLEHFGAKWYLSHWPPIGDRDAEC